MKTLKQYINEDFKIDKQATYKTPMFTREQKYFTFKCSMSNEKIPVNKIVAMGIGQRQMVDVIDNIKHNEEYNDCYILGMSRKTSNSFIVNTGAPYVYNQEHNIIVNDDDERDFYEPVRLCDVWDGFIMIKKDDMFTWEK